MSEEIINNWFISRVFRLNLHRKTKNYSKYEKVIQYLHPALARSKNTTAGTDGQGPSIPLRRSVECRRPRVCPGLSAGVYEGGDSSLLMRI